MKKLFALVLALTLVLSLAAALLFPVPDEDTAEG